MIYNPYPQVDLPFGKDNKYFKTLFDAIYNVDEHYIEYKLKSDNVSNDEMKKIMWKEYLHMNYIISGETKSQMGAFL